MASDGPARARSAPPRRPASITRTPSGHALLNVGCGATFSPEWTNVDLAPATPSVARVDLRGRLPFADGAFDAVYSSHVLEHFSPEQGASLLREMARCLAPGGICRVVVPDLEATCREYLAQLAAVAAEPSERTERRHEWATVNLLDQFVRERSGGRVRSLIVSGRIDEEYVRRSNGDDLVDAIRADEARRRAAPPPGAVARLRSRVRDRLGGPGRTGELHRWGYDRCSLARLMTASGLESVRARTHDASDIPEWRRYALDSDVSGRARKRGSLFMEGRKIGA